MGIQQWLQQTRPHATPLRVEGAEPLAATVLETSFNTPGMAMMHPHIRGHCHHIARCGRARSQARARPQTPDTSLTHVPWGLHAAQSSTLQRVQGPGMAKWAAVCAAGRRTQHLPRAAPPTAKRRPTAGHAWGCFRRAALRSGGTHPRLRPSVHPRARLTTFHRHNVYTYIRGHLRSIAPAWNLRSTPVPVHLRRSPRAGGLPSLHTAAAHPGSSQAAVTGQTWSGEQRRTFRRTWLL